MPPAIKKTEVSLLLCVAAALFAFYWPWLVNAASFYRNDLTAFWHPLIAFVADTVRAHRLPLWNPYLGCGISQAAILTPGIFFPANWLFVCLPFNTALAIIFILDQLLAVVGLFLLLVDFGFGTGPAIFAGITLGLSGFFFSTQSSVALNATAAWFPIAFLCLRRLIKPNGGLRIRWLIATALAICMFVLAGVPEIFVPGLLILAIYAARAGGKEAGFAWKSAGTAYGALLCGIVLAMPALLPAAEWAALSKRATGLNFNEIFTWSAGWYDLVSLVLPQPFGDTMSVDNRFVRLFLPAPSQTPYFATSFIGPLAATFAVFGCVVAWRGRLWAVCLLVLAVLAAVGNNTAVAPLIAKTFSIGAFRYPVKLMFFVDFALALLAAAGMRAALAIPSAVPRTNRLVSAVWLAVIIFGVCLFSMPATFAVLPPFVCPSVAFDTSAAAAWRIGKACMQAGAFGLLACVLCHLFFIRKISAVILSSSSVALQSAVLLSSALFYAHFPGPADYYEQKSVVKERLLRLNGGSVKDLRVALIQADMRAPARLLDAYNRTIGLHEYMRRVLIPLSNVDYRVPSTITFAVGQTRDLDTFAWDTLEAHARGNDLGLARYCQLSSTKFIYAPINLISPGGRPLSRLPALDRRWFTPVDLDDISNICIYEVHRPMPRAYLTSSVRWDKSHAAVVDFIAHPTPDGFDPQKATVLERDASLPAPPNVVPDPAHPFVAVDYAPGVNQATLKVSAARDSFLVVTDQFYPGWQATLDGNSTPIYRANALLRAVFVPAGNHVVGFCYRPGSLLMGFALALASFVLLLAVGLSALVRAQRTVAKG